MRPPPRSCDIFVCVRAATGGVGPACTVFGKNSDRPSEEAHEVVYFPSQAHPPGAALRCTHIEIPQVESTLALVLSRPAWLWGCEMGANECGVVGGNEAVSSLLSGDLGRTPRLLGMDLLRLALERGTTAAAAARICGELLEAHGQGGACAGATTSGVTRTASSSRTATRHSYWRRPGSATGRVSAFRPARAGTYPTVSPSVRAAPRRQA